MAVVALLIDGGHLRILAKRAGYDYTTDYVERIAHACIVEGEHLLRVLYYDCPPFVGRVKKPVSDNYHQFNRQDTWLQELAKRDYFAVRRGSLKFRGWKLKELPGPAQPTDAHYDPDFEQKGVDMRIGLDVATFAENNSVHRLLLITNDTDFVPAMKHARKAGLQIALITFPDNDPTSELLYHSDFRREIGWPPAPDAAPDA